MEPFHPRADELPEEFAVFPLSGALLLPRGRLPLNIFEPRYIALAEDTLAAGRMFAMIQPDPAAAPGAGAPGLYRVGCLGRMSSFSETEDGRFLVTLTGVIRFTVVRELETRRGYRRVRGDFSEFLLDLSAEAGPIGLDRDTLIAALRSYFTARDLDANWDVIRRIPDDVLVSMLAMSCPFDPAEKQALLEAATEAERAAALFALLQIGAATSAQTSHGVS